MSERGVFAVDRGIFDHPSFAPEPFTEREAWQWLISEAGWKPCRRRVGSVSVELARGQLAHSLRFMADKWKWSEARVRRFLVRLKIDAMLDTATDAGVTVITICNYDKYQRVSLPSDAPIDAPIDAAATQQRRKEEDIKDIKEDSGANAPDASASRDVRKDLFDFGLKKLAHITGKTPDSCRSLVGKWLKSVNDEAIHVLGAIDDAERNRVADPVAWINRALQPRTQHGRGNILPAADRLIDKLREINRPPPGLLDGIRGGTGAPHVRLLPSRGRE